MKKEDLLKIIGIREGEDFEQIKSRDFEDLIFSKLKKFGKVKKQVSVLNRGDGRKGRIDLVFQPYRFEYAIELDRKTPRAKSIFKVSNYNDRKGFIITRSPYKIIQI